MGERVRVQERVRVRDRTGYPFAVHTVSPTTRWDLVALAELEELAAMSDTQKLTQVAALMASVKAMGWSETLQEGDEDIWRRWQAIRANADRKVRTSRRR